MYLIIHASQALLSLSVTLAEMTTGRDRMRQDLQTAKVLISD